MLKGDFMLCKTDSMKRKENLGSTVTSNFQIDQEQLNLKTSTVESLKPVRGP